MDVSDDVDINFPRPTKRHADVSHVRHLDVKVRELVAATQGRCVEDEEAAKERKVEKYFCAVMLMCCSNRSHEHVLH